MRAVHWRFRVCCLHNKTLHPYLLQAIMIDICVMLFVIVRSYLPAEIRWSIALAVRGQPCRGKLDLPANEQVGPSMPCPEAQGHPCCLLLLYKAVAVGRADGQQADVAVLSICLKACA